MDSVIKKIFDNMLSVVREGIEDDFLDEINKAYMEFLHNRYFEIDKELNNLDFDKLYVILLECEMNYWKNMSSSMKKSLLIKDTALSSIVDIANKASQLAKLRFESNKLIDVNVCDEYISKINSFLPNVNGDNEALANWYATEAIGDLYYASNQTDKMSLRTAR